MNECCDHSSLCDLFTSSRRGALYLLRLVVVNLYSSRVFARLFCSNNIAVFDSIFYCNFIYLIACFFFRLLLAINPCGRSDVCESCDLAQGGECCGLYLASA